MTQFFLVYLPERDIYAIKTIGLARRFIVIYRDSEMSDAAFEVYATEKFRLYLENETKDIPAIKGARIIASEYIL